jgi:hypothetical protein
MILDLIKLVIGEGAKILERSSKRKDARLEAETKVLVARAEAEAKRLEKAQDAEIAWDNTVASQMSTSWKDEWFTIMLSIPLMLAFMGEWGRDRVAEGFQAVSGVPEWYKVAFLTAIAASFGVRALVDRFGFGIKK